MSVKSSPKARSGLSTLGVEGLPKADSPLDPGPGLGDKLSLGLLSGNASPKLHFNSQIVTAITVPSRIGPVCVDLRVHP
jgi:hypothetical protein